MEKKRKLKDIGITAVVEISTILGGIEAIKTTVDIGERIAPYVEKYAGLIGSGAVEYGLPMIVGLGMLSISYTATKATYNYLLEQQRE